jgi:hypothetical protein
VVVVALREVGRDDGTGVLGEEDGAGLLPLTPCAGRVP